MCKDVFNVHQLLVFLVLVINAFKIVRVWGRGLLGGRLGAFGFVLNALKAVQYANKTTPASNACQITPY